MYSESSEINRIITIVGHIMGVILTSAHIEQKLIILYCIYIDGSLINVKINTR